MGIVRQGLSALLGEPTTVGRAVLIKVDTNRNELHILHHQSEKLLACVDLDDIFDEEGNNFTNDL